MKQHALWYKILLAKIRNIPVEISQDEREKIREEEKRKIMKEMHMTQMQFMNTGAREIVPFLDTTFGRHGARHMYLRRRRGPPVGLTK